MWKNLLLATGCVPVMVLMAARSLHRWRLRRAGTRLPFGEKLLRPPGYSLGRQLSDLGDDYISWILTGFICALVSVGAWRFAPTDLTGELIYLAFFALAAAFSTVLAWRKLLKIHRVRLGLLGEQVMAQQLHLLLPGGYHVFHDLPGDGKWNVDHVAVGPGGVFAIETKARTKKPGPAGEPDYKVRFDGKALRFPGYTDSKTLDQARANARWLARMLSKAIGEPVTAHPIVALPGWLVNLEVPNPDVTVLSGKQVPGYIARRPATLSEKPIKQIAYQLEQRCRDVEF